MIPFVLKPYRFSCFRDACNDRVPSNGSDGEVIMSIVLSIVLSILNVVTTLLHILGCYLLTYQYNNGVQNPQQLYLINLSISEGDFLQLIGYGLDIIVYSQGECCDNLG